MLPEQIPEALLQHLCYSSCLTTDEARHLVAKVLAFYAEPLQDFVRHRHLELQGQGHNNKHIYSQLQLELEQRRFPASLLGERQSDQAPPHVVLHQQHPRKLVTLATRAFSSSSLYVFRNKTHHRIDMAPTYGCSGRILAVYCDVQQHCLIGVDNP